MSQPRLERVEELFHRAVDLDPAQRSTFLDNVCAGDQQLRRAVEELLKHDDGGGTTDAFLVSPVARARAEAELAAGAPTPPITPRDFVDQPSLDTHAIAGYEILGELGRGGMGVVYRARQLSLNRTVALKMLRDASLVTAEEFTRFRREAEVLARLQHCNVVQIYGVGDHEGRPYFVMEYVAGSNLAKKLNGAPQPPGPAAHLIEVLARAVHAVHQCGIIHRDLKPANVLLQPAGLQPVAFGIPKITDFGLAKDQSLERGLTRTGQTMGTPSYMAPEQARGQAKTVGPAADVYALGAILYELITGRPPFNEASPAETIARVLAEDPVPPSRLQPKCPRDLETICLKCLEKEPAQRYTSALDLAEDLRRFQAGRPIRARAANAGQRAWRWCRRHPVVASLMTLTFLLAVALVITILAANARLERALAKAERTAHEERLQDARLHVALGMRALEQGDAPAGLLLLTEALRIAEDDQERDNRIRVATALRQCPRLERLLPAGRSVLGVRLSPEGCWVITADADTTVRVWDMDKGNLAGPALKPAAAVIQAALSPDGRLLATAGADGKGQVWDIRRGRARTPPLPVGGPVNRFVFHTDGRVLVTRRADFRIQLWNLASGKEIPVKGIARKKITYATISDDGRRVLIVQGPQTNQVLSVVASQPAATSLDLRENVIQAAFSLDGRRIALAGPDNAVRIREVFTGKLIAGPLRHPRPINQIAFSPRGNRLITAGDDGAARIWQLPTGELLLPPLRHGGAVKQVRFSPGGRFVATAGDDHRVRVWDATTGQPVSPFLEHNNRAGEAYVSAGGKQLVTIALDGTARLWNLDGLTSGKRLPGPVGPVPELKQMDGRRLVRSADGKAVQVVDGATGEARGPFMSHAALVNHAAFSLDGRRVVTASDDGTARIWDAGTAKPLTPPLRHQGPVHFAAFRQDGKQVLTASADHTARLWSAATGEPLTPPLRHPRPVVRAFFSPGGSHAITICDDETARTWDLTPENRPVATLELLAQVLAGARVDERGALVPLEPDQLQAAWSKVAVGSAGL
jgi:WD40 repeat protein/tRNA A-37 threonylcarbamoyl transferase component Bud32